MKKCSKCKQEKPEEAFHKNRCEKDGLYPQCKDCRKPSTKANYEKNKMRMNEQVRKWERENSAQRRASMQTAKAKRLSRKAGATQHFTLKEWRELCSNYGNRCLCCNATDRPLTVDHVVPRSKGGVNTIDNIQPLCHACNLRKGIQTIDFRPKE